MVTCGIIFSSLSGSGSRPPCRSCTVSMQRRVGVLLRMQGLPTIRAYAAESHFQESFISHLSLNGQWWYAYLATARWIGFRLDLIATITLTMAVLLAMAVRTEVGGSAQGAMLEASVPRGWGVL
eukprot:GHRQ01032705.1.p2 GENE.GHRQ01032705.1~~GHRQ01032705.1.p2  ORF type:complete len:124 (-),score=25.37 GHRQ01032705.1:526-897(-)